MDDSARSAIITAAVIAAGPDTGDGTWGATVRDKAATIAAMNTPMSPIGKLVDAMTDDDTKVFSGTVLAVKKEESSKRALVTLKTRASTHHPSGVETARTDRTDNPAGLALARKLRDLKYHRVMVWLQMEQMSGSTNKVRVLIHVEDLGVDPDVADVAADGTVVPKDQVVEDLLAAFAAEK